VATHFSARHTRDPPRHVRLIKLLDNVAHERYSALINFLIQFARSGLDLRIRSGLKHGPLIHETKMKLCEMKSAEKEMSNPHNARTISNYDAYTCTRENRSEKLTIGILSIHRTDRIRLIMSG